MSEIGYDDWDEIVKRANANLVLIEGNKKRAEIGEKVEKLMLDYALKERAKYPEPEAVEEKTDEIAPQV